MSSTATTIGPISTRTPTTSSNAHTFTITAHPAPPPPLDTYNLRLFALREVRDLVQHLVGDLLTLIDASIADPQQNTAIKRLVKRTVWDSHFNSVSGWAERQASLEQSAVLRYEEIVAANPGVEIVGPTPATPQSWYGVILGDYVPDAYNPFPFSVAPLIDPAAHD